MMGQIIQLIFQQYLKFYGVPINHISPALERRPYHNILEFIEENLVCRQE